jgi:hypothetical protein
MALSRMVTPAPWFRWPLVAGRRWDHRGVFEDHNGRTNFTDRFAVVDPEPVEVPAGRFQAMKVRVIADAPSHPFGPRYPPVNLKKAVDLVTGGCPGKSVLTG